MTQTIRAFAVLSLLAFALPAAAMENAVPRTRHTISNTIVDQIGDYLQSPAGLTWLATHQYNKTTGAVIALSKTMLGLSGDVASPAGQIGTTIVKSSHRLIIAPNIVMGSMAAATANAAALNAAIQTLGAAGGGVVELPCNTTTTGFYVASTILNNVSRVTVEGCGSDMAHDAGMPTYGTTVMPTFAGSPVLQHNTPYGATAARNTGGGFTKLNVASNSIGTQLLRVDSVREGTYDLYLIDAEGTEAAYFTSGVSGTDLAESADDQGMHINLRVRQLDGAAAQAANCVTLDASSNANVSYNEDVRITCQHMNGSALVLKGADNNNIKLSAYRVAGGTGNTVYAYGIRANGQGAYSNTFQHIGGIGPIFEEGTATSGVTAGVTNKIIDLDEANSTPIAAAGNGSYWDTTQPIPYTGTATCASGTLTSYSYTGFYVHQTMTTTFVYNIAVTTQGSCSGALTLSLPVPLAMGVIGSAGVARDRAVGTGFFGTAAPGASTMTLDTPVGGYSGSYGVVTGQIAYDSL